MCERIGNRFDPKLRRKPYDLLLLRLSRELASVSLYKVEIFLYRIWKKGEVKMGVKEKVMHTYILIGAIKAYFFGFL